MLHEGEAYETCLEKTCFVGGYCHLKCDCASESDIMLYCRFGNFRENFIFVNSISDVENSRLRQYLPISINDRVILPFREGFKVLAKISKFTVY